MKNDDITAFVLKIYDGIQNEINVLHQRNFVKNNIEKMLIVIDILIRIDTRLVTIKYNKYYYVLAI
jgi:hypothetical protein